jgi:hypothetical protein
MSPLPGLELGAKIFSKLGTLHMESFTILRHANGGTNAVSFELYAHMENVVIDVPTAIPQGYTMQEAANVVKKIIRSTAKATEIAPKGRCHSSKGSGWVQGLTHRGFIRV